MLGFRVWDIKNKIMIYKSSEVDPLVMGMDGEFSTCCGTTWPSGYLSDCFKDLYIPMQSTAVNDMDCIPIFEKDILWLDKNGGRYVVESAYQLYNDFFSESGRLWQHEIGIIGNIYENPQLLEKLNGT